MTTTTRIAPEADPLAWLEPDPSTSPAAAMSAELRFDPEAWEDPDRTPLWVTTAHHNSGTPAAIWHGIILRWTLPLRVDAAEFTRRVNEGWLDDLLARIAAGHAVAWNGSNHVGTLTADADSAAEALSDRLDVAPELASENAGLWEAEDWLSEGFDPADVGMTGQTTDAELTALAEALDREALAEQAVLTGTLDWLRGRRDRLRDDDDR
jgi:hypothetical protein